MELSENLYFENYLIQYLFIRIYMKMVVMHDSKLLIRTSRIIKF
jgi:hypothetical protein